MTLSGPRDTKGPSAAIICYFAEACCEVGVQEPGTCLVSEINVPAEPTSPWGFAIAGSRLAGHDSLDVL